MLHITVTTLGSWQPYLSLWEMMSSTTRVTMYDWPGLQGSRTAPQLSAPQPDKADWAPAVLSAMGQYHAAHQGPCQSSGATGCRPPGLPGALRSRVAPSRHSRSDAHASGPAGDRH